MTNDFGEISEKGAGTGVSNAVPEPLVFPGRGQHRPHASNHEESTLVHHFSSKRKWNKVQVCFISLATGR